MEFQVAPGYALVVDGKVADSTGLSRGEQERRGWCNLPVADLAVAHVANFIATGRDLFDGDSVRARERGQALCFSAHGLNLSINSHDEGAVNIAAASSLVSHHRKDILIGAYFGKRSDD